MGKYHLSEWNTFIFSAIEDNEWNDIVEWLNSKPCQWLEIKNNGSTSLMGIFNSPAQYTFPLEGNYDISEKRVFHLRVIAIEQPDIAMMFKTTFIGGDDD